MACDLFGGLTGWDLEGFHNGGDTELWKRLGAFQCTIEDDERGPIEDVRFVVWALNACAVQVIGDFNWWTGDPMQLILGSGVRGTFIEGLKEETLYKFRIQGSDGVWRGKVDPLAWFFEQAPANASIIYELKYIWSDDEWIAKREKPLSYKELMNIYEARLGGWRRDKSYLDLAEEPIFYVKWQSYIHVKFMPLAEHPLEPSWGYQVTGYYSPTSRFGKPDDLRFLIDKFHQAGIGVILDWVPGHSPKDDWALDRLDGTALCEHADLRQGEHMDWGTYIFNYGRNEMKSFLVSNALYWLSEFHIDGLRVDAVASMLYLDYSHAEDQWVPNKYGGRENLEAVDFLRYVNRHMCERHPGMMMITEESTSFQGATKPIDRDGFGFGFEWNMGWMNDTLRYLAPDPVYCQYEHNLLMFVMVYQYSENFVLPISHDEVVYDKGSMINRVPQDDWRKFATLRAFYLFMRSSPNKQLVFMGSEFAQRPEFNEAASLEWWTTKLWGHGGLQWLFRDLNMIYRDNLPLFELDDAPESFTWINANDRGYNTLSRVCNDSQGNHVACFTNLFPEPLRDYPIGLPSDGEWEEILSTDSETYDDSGQFGNLGVVTVHDEPRGHSPASAEMTIPPLGPIWLRHKAK